MPGAGIAAVVLSGGASRRFGAPKILQEFAGENFLTRIHRNLLAAGARPIILVLGHGAGTVRPRLPRLPELHIAVNPAPQKGQFSSLQTGLRELGRLAAPVRGVLVCLVDQPHLLPQTYRRMFELAEKAAERVIVPTFGGRGGHPVFLPGSLFARILDEPPTAALRTVLRQAGNSPLRVELDDPGILEDIDTPEDLRRLEKSAGR